jgi:hypothetical protein
VLAQGDKDRHDKLVDLIGTLWNASSCDVVECAECDLNFAWPFVAGDGEFYNLAYPHAYYPKTKWEYTAIVAALEGMKNPMGKVLEIGSGFGYFLEQICPRFFAREDAVATEYNDVAVSRLCERGCTVLNGDIRTPAFSEFARTFNFIFMFQVLEHMDNLDELTQRLTFVAADRADLFIAVPNPIRIEFNEHHDSLRDMPPNHISRWSTGAFAALGKKAVLDLSGPRGALQGSCVVVWWTPRKTAIFCEAKG